MHSVRYCSYKISHGPHANINTPDTLFTVIITAWLFVSRQVKCYFLFSVLVVGDKFSEGENHCNLCKMTKNGFKCTFFLFSHRHIHGV